MRQIIDTNCSEFRQNYSLSKHQGDSTIGADHKFLSNNKKFILHPQLQNAWHFLYDLIGQVLLILENEDKENIELIFLLNDHNKKVYNNAYSFIDDFLKKCNFKNYYILNHRESIQIGEFYVATESSEPSFAMHKFIYETFLKHYPSDINTPFKNVYISRANVRSRTDNEYIIEKFFEEIGFEIYRKGNFGDYDFLEDIKYFRDVKTIAGFSGAGLVNAIFMQPGGTMIELSVPQIDACGPSELKFPEERVIGRHLFHPISAFIKEHLYIQVPVLDSKSTTALAKIKELQILK
jgi:hypothetical protein